MEVSNETSTWGNLWVDLAGTHNVRLVWYSQESLSFYFCWVCVLEWGRWLESSAARKLRTWLGFREQYCYADYRLLKFAMLLVYLFLLLSVLRERCLIWGSLTKSSSFPWFWIYHVVAPYWLAGRFNSARIFNILIEYSSGFNSEKKIEKNIRVAHCTSTSMF